MNMYVPWVQHWQEAEAYRQPESCDEYDMAVRANAKQRHGLTGHTKIKTREWESMVSESIDAPEEPLTGRIGLELLFLINSKSPPKHDLDNAIKSVQDAFNRRAYKDDNQIDYLKAFRVWSPEVENRIIARVYERAL